MKAINRRFIALLLAGILFSLIVPLRSGAAESGTVFLWEVKSEKAAAYLLGSIHLMKAQFYPLPDTIENAFARSDTLVVEADIEEAGPEKLQELMQAGALYPAGDSLKNHLSSATYEQVAAKLRSYGMDITLFNSVQPWALALTLTTIELTRLGFDPEYGIDRHFIRKARGAKKILALESAEYQIDLLRDFSEKDQEFFLLYTLKDLDKAGTEIDRIVTAWSSGDTGTVEAILLESVKADPAIEPVYEKIIYKRNEGMASKIEGLLKTERTCFIVVGAGHLVGKKSIIELLRPKGYSIRQL